MSYLSFILVHTGPKSYIPSMTWMPLWQHFLEVRHKTCVKRWLKQKGRPSNVFAGDNQALTLLDINPYYDGLLRLKSWDFVPMLGLVDE